MFIAAKYEEMYAPEIGKIKIKTFSCNFCPQLFYNIFRRLCLHHWSRLFRIANSWNGNENLGRIRIRFGTSIAFTFSTQKFQSWQRRCPYSHPRQVCHGIDFGQLRNGPLGKFTKILIWINFTKFFTILLNFQEPSKLAAAALALSLYVLDRDEKSVEELWTPTLVSWFTFFF